MAIVEPSTDNTDQVATMLIDGPRALLYGEGRCASCCCCRGHMGWP